MDATRAFLILSAVIGLMQASEALLLQKSRGRLTCPAVLFSLIESLWAIPCAAALLGALDVRVPTFLPLSFVLYCVVGWAYGLLMLKPAPEEAAKEAAQNPAVPALSDFKMYPAYILSALLFGAYFCGTSLFLLSQR